MRLRITHRTEYAYDGPLAYALQELRLRPKSSHGQNVISWSTTVDGGSKELEFHDQHNNHVELISFNPGGRAISVLSAGEVETSDTAGLFGRHGGYAPLWYFNRITDRTRPGPHTRKIVKALGQEFADDISRLHALSAAIARQVSYLPGVTDATTLAEEALEAGKGVCQDHAHIFIAAARLMGFPARYVSGYLMMDDRPEQEASHAWAEAHIDALGWVGFDISNGISPDERYVRVATGLDYGEAAPVSGITRGTNAESMIVTLQVQQ
ncbi:MAG: transglutaminase family protein [Rhodobiaceae bacterium]|nr:transglutaminase family protein [Rhodobiaceae bacterium]